MPASVVNCVVQTCYSMHWWLALVSRLKAVATALSIPAVDGQVRAEGDFDFRGTLGDDREAPVGFKEVRLSFELNLEREVEEAVVDKLLKLTERYCVVLQTIAKKPSIDCGIKVAWKSEDRVEKSLIASNKM